MTRRDLIFRVFVSSTFSDLIEERNALQAKDGPFDNLRKYCQERGARFQAIDLRWGVSQEAALDQQTMNICLDELRRCQVLSPLPNFIVLLGNRYGWRPLPAQIEAAEFEALLSAVPGVDKALLFTDRPVPVWRDGAKTGREGWYRKDLNAVPAIYVLQHRTTEFSNGASVDDKHRVRQEEMQDWGVIERRAREALCSAIKKLGWPEKDPRRFKYEASATHQEIHAGALQAEKPDEHVFCYFRGIEGLPADATAATYRDIKDGVVDAEAETRLNDLKAELGGDSKRKGLLPATHVHAYRASWQKGRPAYDWRDLCNDLEKNLKAVIDREIAAFKQKPCLEHERETHHEFAEERSRHFVGRKDILQRIAAYLDSDNTRPLVVHGKSGSGKTAVLAKASQVLGKDTNAQKVAVSQQRTTHNGQLTISRFIGATPGSSDLRTLLSDLCREFGVTEIPQDMNDLVRTFRSKLSTEQAGSKDEAVTPQPVEQGKIVLFLDALDQLNPGDNARMLYWLPRELKPNVKLVLSVLETEKAVTTAEGHPSGSESSAFRVPHSAFADDPFDLARRIWPESLVAVGPLDSGSGAELLDHWLREAGRTLQNEQRAEVLDMFAKCPLPLYLKLASEEARRWRSWEGVASPLSGTVDSILEQLLAQLERPEHHGVTLVSRSLAYLAAAKNGLTEDELIDLLSADRDIMEWFYSQSPTEQAKAPADRIKGLPVLIWSRLFADLQSYMTQRRADGTVVMDFYHRQVGEAVRKRYLSTEETRIQAHLHLADYFDTLDFWAESLEAQRARAKRLPPTPRPANVRKVVELPYHRLEVAKLGGKDDPKSKYWDAVADLLTNWQFLEAKAEADPNADFGMRNAEGSECGMQNSDCGVAEEKRK